MPGGWRHLDWHQEADRWLTQHTSLKLIRSKNCLQCSLEVLISLIFNGSFSLQLSLKFEFFSIRLFRFVSCLSFVF